MQAEPLKSRDAKESSRTELGQPFRIAPENDHGSFVGVAASPPPVRGVTDQELALVAFRQAVALRDRCVECARASRVGARP
jgi:hypothetical protein